MKQRMKYAALAFTLGLMALIFYFRANRRRTPTNSARP